MNVSERFADVRFEGRHARAVEGIRKSKLLEKSARSLDLRTEFVDRGFVTRERVVVDGIEACDLHARMLLEERFELFL